MIKLHPPKLSQSTIQELNKILKTNWLSTAGKNIDRLEKKLTIINKVKYCCATVNGTSALDLAIKSISNNNQKNEIITSNMSFISSVNAILYNNHNPIFLNVDKYFNLNVDDFEKFINEETYKKNGYLYNKSTNKKIIALLYVNLYGRAIDIIKIKKIIKKRKIKLYLIEDAAESLGSYYNVKNKIPVGSLADISCLSFNANKIVTGGSGGAILTNKRKLYKYCAHKANQCKAKNFTSDGLGYNYKITNINATILLNELKHLKEKIKKKRKIVQEYYKHLKDNKYIKFLNFDINKTNNHWLILIKINISKNITNKLIKYLFSSGIEVRPVFTPFTEINYLKKFQTYKINNFDTKVKNSICIPSGTNLTNKEIKKISKYILKFIDEKI